MLPFLRQLFTRLGFPEDSAALAIDNKAVSILLALKTQKAIWSRPSVKHAFVLFCQYHSVFIVKSQLKPHRGFNNILCLFLAGYSCVCQ